MAGTRFSRFSTKFDVVDDEDVLRRDLDRARSLPIGAGSDFLDGPEMTSSFSKSESSWMVKGRAVEGVGIGGGGGQKLES